MPNTFKPPPPDATPAEKQTALIAFRSALKQNMARHSTEQKEKLVQAINAIEHQKITLRKLENLSDSEVIVNMYELVVQQSSLMADLYEQETTDWNKVVDDFIAEKIAEAEA